MKIRSEMLVILHLVDRRILRKFHVWQLKDHGPAGHGGLNPTNEICVTYILRPEGSVMRHEVNAVTGLIEDAQQKKESERGTENGPRLPGTRAPAKEFFQQ